MTLAPSSRRGFTLIEVSVVVVIVVTLSLVAFYSLRPVRVASRDAKRLSDVHTLQTALSQYYERNSFYPTFITPGSALVSPAGGAKYLDTIPSNALPYNDNGCLNRDYSYKSISGGASYILSTCIGKGEKGSEIIVASPRGLAKAPNAASVGVWRLNGSGDTLAQSETSSQNLSFYGEPAIESDTANCIEGSCVTLDSSIGQSLSVNVPQGSSTYTVAFWFKANALREPEEETYGPERQLFDSAEDKVGISLLWNQDESKYFLHVWNGSLLSTSLSPEIGTYYHIVLTSDGTTLKLYVDGSLLASKAAGPSMIAGTAIWGDAWPSGQTPTRQSRYTDGTFDEMRIYTSALTPAQVNTLYLSGL